MFMLDRREDLSFEEFATHWEEEHAPIAIDGVPGLRKYTISFPDEPEKAPHDGLAELYFDSAEEMHEAMDSEAMQEAVADVPNFADGGSAVQLFVEEREQVDRT